MQDQNVKINPYIFIILHIYIIVVLSYQLIGIEEWTYVSNWLFNHSKRFYIGNIVSPKTIIEFGIVINTVAIFIRNKSLKILSLISWLLFIYISPQIYTPQEEFISLIIITSLFMRKDDTIDKLWKEILFILLGISLFYSAVHKIISPSWINGFAIESLFNTPLSFEYLKYIEISKSINLFLGYIGIILQGSSIILIFPSKKIRNISLIILTLFFISLFFILSLPSVLIGMLIYIKLLYILNK